eukprot:9656111-Alexandrium_andersonii.AAC.1
MLEMMVKVAVVTMMAVAKAEAIWGVLQGGKWLKLHLGCAAEPGASAAPRRLRTQLRGHKYT